MKTTIELAIRRLEKLKSEHHEEGIIEALGLAITSLKNTLEEDSSLLEEAKILSEIQ